MYSTIYKHGTDIAPPGIGVYIVDKTFKVGI
jgi:hypothetical protein